MKICKKNYIGKIEEFGSFEIILQGNKIINIENNSAKNISNSKMLECMEIFIERSIYCKEDWTLTNNIEKIGDLFM